MDECALDKITKDAIEFVSKSDPKLVSIERKKSSENKNLGKAVGSEREVLAREPSRVGGESGK